MWGGPRAFEDLWEKWLHFWQMCQKRNERRATALSAACSRCLLLFCVSFLKVPPRRLPTICSPRPLSLATALHAFTVTGHPDLKDPDMKIQRDIRYYIFSPRNRFLVNRASFLTFLILIVTLEPVHVRRSPRASVSACGAAALLPGVSLLS